MNKTATIGFILCSLVLNSAIARADGDLKVGIIDMQKCIQSSDSGKKAKAELEAAFNKKKKELQEQEQAFKTAEEAFQKKQGALSETARKEQQEKLREKFMKYQENLQRSQAEIQKKEQDMSAPIIQKVREKVTEIAKKRGLGIVLEKNENIVIHSEDRYDITDEVMKAL